MISHYLSLYQVHIRHVMWNINMQGYIAQTTEQLYGWKINLVLVFHHKRCVLGFALKANV